MGSLAISGTLNDASWGVAMAGAVGVGAEAPGSVRAVIYGAGRSWAYGPKPDLAQIIVVTREHHRESRAGVVRQASSSPPPAARQARPIRPSPNAAPRIILSECSVG